MDENMEYIAIYSRKSKFTGKGESIENQIELCKEYVRTHYGDNKYNIVVYEDEGFSGGNLNRPDFKNMMKDAKEKKFKAIIVYRLDRISRNISDFSSLIEQLSKLNIAFISIKEQFDTGTPMGRAMMYIASVFSQLERETIAERIRDNMQELAKTGRWLGGTTPTGYTSESVKNVTIDGKSKKSCKLKLIPKEADIIKMIYDLFLQTGSLTNTQSELMCRGIVTKNNKQFTRFSIKAILQNPVYMIADKNAYNYFLNKQSDINSTIEEFNGEYGVLAYNRTEQEKGKATIYLSEENWIVSVGKHQGIVPSKIWIETQENLQKNKIKSYHRPRINEALLTGLIFCKCGSRMYPKLSKRKNNDNKLAFTYVCKLKEQSKGNLCKSNNVNGNQLDDMVINEIKKLDEDKKRFINNLEQSRKSYTSSYIEKEECIIKLEEQKKEIDKRIDVLVDSIISLKDETTISYIQKRINQLNKDKQLIENNIEQIKNVITQNNISDKEFDNISNIIINFKNVVDRMNIQQKRKLTNNLIKRVYYDGTTIHIIFVDSTE